jgi:1-acyl-sn-glycerol-3-phosphate acyltransferase
MKLWPSLKSLGSWAVEKNLSADERSRLMANLPDLNSAGYDDWGFNPEVALAALALTRPLYDKYFRVEATGIDNVPTGRVLLIANHSGQIPLDGALIGTAMALHADPPRIVRGMVERWFPSLPWISTLFYRAGQTVGDPANCRRLLEQDQAVMVFPEGVRGSGKTIWKRYQLQRFGTGFVRLALETKTPIVPIAVVGAEETYPSVYNIETLAKLLGAPYAPITPFFPLLGPLGLLPVPCKVRLYFGEPLYFEGDADAADPEIQEKVNVVMKNIEVQIARGLKERGVKYF